MTVNKRRREWERSEMTKDWQRYFKAVLAEKAGYRASAREVCRYLRFAEKADLL